MEQSPEFGSTGWRPEAGRTPPERAATCWQEAGRLQAGNRETSESLAQTQAQPGTPASSATGRFGMGRGGPSLSALTGFLEGGGRLKSPSLEFRGQNQPLGLPQ